MPPSPTSADNQTPRSPAQRAPSLKQQFKRQQPQWKFAAAASRELIGPVKGAQPEPPKRAIIANNLTEQKKLGVAIPVGVEYLQDGNKTATLITDALWKNLRAWLGAYAKNHSAPETFAALLELKPQFDHALKLLGNVFGDPATAVPFQTYKPQARWAPSALETWLRAQKIETEPPSGLYLYRRPLTDRQLPFIVYKNAQADFALAQLTVYWLERGLNQVYWDNAITELIKRPRQDVRPTDPQQWDHHRLQMTLRAPQIVFCRGVLRGDAWEKVIARKLVQKSNAAKPFVLILAEGVERKPKQPAPQDFFVAVLPAGDATREAYKKMAKRFDAPVVDLERCARENNWARMAEGLTRVPIVLLDRQRVVLAPEKNRAHAEDDKSPWDWFPKRVHALSLPLTDKTSIAEAEIALRARIEQEAKGVAAGGGTAYCRAARKLDALGEPLRGWLREALQAPMRQILDNADVPKKQIATLVNRIAASDDPMLAYLVDHKKEWTEGILRGAADAADFEIIEHKFPILVGSALKLGVVTPPPELERITRRALYAAWQLAMNDCVARASSKREKKGGPNG